MAVPPPRIIRGGRPTPTAGPAPSSDCCPASQPESSLSYHPRRAVRLTATRLENRWTPAAGDVDPTFGNGGIANLIFTDGGFNTSAVVSLPDGSIVVAGDLDSGDLSVVKLTAAGTLDPSFGTDGRVVLPATAAGGSQAADIKILPDGRMLVLGSAVDAAPNAGARVVARLSPAGQPRRLVRCRRPRPCGRLGPQPGGRPGGHRRPHLERRGAADGRRPAGRRGSGRTALPR